MPVKGLDQLGRIAATGIGEAAGHLGERLIGKEGAPVVVQVPSLELLDEVAALIGVLGERLDHDSVDAAGALGSRHTVHRLEDAPHRFGERDPCHQRNSPREGPPGPPGPVPASGVPENSPIPTGAG